MSTGTTRTLRTAQVAQHLAQRREVEHVVEALAGGLEEDRERRVLRRPPTAGRPPAGAAATAACAGRAGGGAAAAPGPRTRGSGRRTARCPAAAAMRMLVDLVGVDQQLVDRQLVDRLGQAEDDAVVAPHELDVEPPPLAEPGLQRHGPRRVHLGAERRQHAHPPVADLVAEALDHDRAVVGHRAGGLGLLVEVRDEVGGRPLVEPDVGLQACRPPGRRGAADARGRTRRPPGPARAGGRDRRRARTASSPAGPAPA